MIRSYKTVDSATFYLHFHKFIAQSGWKLFDIISSIVCGLFIRIWEGKLFYNMFRMKSTGYIARLSKTCENWLLTKPIHRSLTNHLPPSHVLPIVQNHSIAHPGHPPQLLHSGNMNLETIQLVFLRHGQSTWNQQNIFIGMTDTPLTEDGWFTKNCYLTFYLKLRQKSR